MGLMLVEVYSYLCVLLTHYVTYTEVIPACWCHK